MSTALTDGITYLQDVKGSLPVTLRLQWRAVPATIVHMSLFFFFRKTTPAFIESCTASYRCLADKMAEATNKLVNVS